MDTTLATAQSVYAQNLNSVNTDTTSLKSDDNGFMDLVIAQMRTKDDSATTAVVSKPQAYRSPTSSTSSSASSYSARANAARKEEADKARDNDRTAAARKAADARKADDTDNTDQTGTTDDTDDTQGTTSANNGGTGAADSSDDTADLPADLQKLLEEIAAQLNAEGTDAAKTDAKADTAGKTVETAAAKTDAAQPLTLALLSPEGKQKLLAALQNLMNGLPASSRPTIETLENGVLKKLDSTALTADGAKADTTSTGMSALIVSGLTPQQLTDLMKKLKDGDDKDAANAAGELMGTMVQINPVDIKKEAIFQPRSSILPAQNAGQSSGQNQIDKMLLMAAANANKSGSIKGAATGTGDASTDGTMGSSADGSTSGTASNGKTELTSMSTLTGIGGTEDKSTGFDRMLRIFETARQQTGAAATHGTGQAQTPAKTADLTAGNSVLPAAIQADGDLTAPVSTNGLYTDGVTLSSLSASSGSTGNFVLTGTAQLSSLITSAPQAIYPHPATQQVAATIAKTTSDDDSTALTIHLDPAELGRVSVKMEFRDDKTVRAVISADKPETFMMLQRDAHVLQRSLHDAGLDTGSNGLTFQLSQDGSAFGQQPRQDQGQTGSQRGSSSSSDTMMTVETTMDWSVDATGTLHYSVLA